MLSFAFCTAVARIVPFSKLVRRLRAMLIFRYLLAAFVIEAVFRRQGCHWISLITAPIGKVRSLNPIGFFIADLV